jgi:hypothetical protein
MSFGGKGSPSLRFLFSEAVVVRLIGGLGNQMFQYAAARAVAARCNAPLMLDISWFAGEAERRFALSPFRISAKKLDLAPARPRWNSRWYRTLQRFAHRFNRRVATHKFGMPIYRETSFCYDSRVRALQTPVYMDGYFQSEKYFAGCRNIIFEDFQISHPPRSEAQTLLERIQASDAICMHIRRGDYVTDPATKAFHGLCSMDYYRRGLQDIAENLGQPECFVFSDDPAWVHDNVKLDLPMTVVDIHGPDEAHEDLRLMAACHSYVIANSSMSWWGAWLGRRAGKRVVAPRQWVQAASLDTRDLIPDDWVRL